MKFPFLYSVLLCMLYMYIQNPNAQQNELVM